MSHQLRVFSALAEDQVQFPPHTLNGFKWPLTSLSSRHIEQLTKASNLSFRGSKISDLCSCLHLCAYLHTYTKLNAEVTLAPKRNPSLYKELANRPIHLCPRQTRCPCTSNRSVLGRGEALWAWCSNPIFCNNCWIQGPEPVSSSARLKPIGMSLERELQAAMESQQR